MECGSWLCCMFSAVYLRKRRVGVRAFFSLVTNRYQSFYYFFLHCFSIWFQLLRSIASVVANDEYVVSAAPLPEV